MAKMEMMKCFKKTAATFAVLLIFVFTSVLAIPASADDGKSNIIAYSVSYTADAVKLTLSGEDGNTIRYTTNGKKPDGNSKLYTKRISAKKQYTVRAVETDKSGNTVATLKLVIMPRVSKVTLEKKSNRLKRLRGLL